MLVSAINGVSSTARLSFGNGDREDDDKAKSVQKKGYTYTFHNHTVNSEQLKEPVVVAGTLVGAAVISYLSVQCIVAGVLPRWFPKFSINCEKNMRNAANSIKSKAEKWSVSNTAPVKYAGKIIKNAESFTRNVYKKVAYVGLPETLTAKERTYNAFGNIAGTAAFCITPYKLCTKDENNDGIKDIMQHRI